MATLLIIFVWFLNFGISWFNARSCGLTIVETKSHGGWPHFMNWMGRIMSYCGFSWCLLIPILLGANQFGYISKEEVLVGLQLGYIIIIPQVLFSGFFIMLDSWAQAYRQRTWGSYGTAAWNTYAQIHNTYHAISGLGEAFESVLGYFSSSGKSSSSDDDDDSGGKAAVLLVILVVIALVGGVLLTNAIVNYYAGRTNLPTK